MHMLRMRRVHTKDWNSSTHNVRPSVKDILQRVQAVQPALFAVIAGFTKNSSKLLLLFCCFEQSSRGVTIAATRSIEWANLTSFRRPRLNHICICLSFCCDRLDLTLFSLLTRAQLNPNGGQFEIIIFFESKVC